MEHAQPLWPSEPASCQTCSGRFRICEEKERSSIPSTGLLGWCLCLVVVLNVSSLRNPVDWKEGVVACLTLTTEPWNLNPSGPVPEPGHRKGRIELVPDKNMDLRS